MCWICNFFYSVFAIILSIIIYKLSVIMPQSDIKLVCRILMILIPLVTVMRFKFTPRRRFRIE
jgi:hypothetical protein